MRGTFSAYTRKDGVYTEFAPTREKTSLKALSGKSLFRMVKSDLECAIRSVKKTPLQQVAPVIAAIIRDLEVMRAIGLSRRGE